MGILFSCLRHRRPRGEESEPLLSSQPSGVTSPVGLDLKLLSKKLVRIVSALNSGKLPSQDQVNAFVRFALKSEILLDDNGRGALSPAGQRLLKDLRQFLGILSVFGQEKNYDDKIQDTVFHARLLFSSTISEELISFESVELDSAFRLESAMASDIENDFPLLISSLRTLLSLFLTSTSLRLLLSNISLLIQQQLATATIQGVQKIEDVAGKAAGAAAKLQSLAERAANVAESTKLGAASVEEVAQDAEHVVLDLSSETASDTGERALHELEALKSRAEGAAERTLGEARKLSVQEQESTLPRSERFEGMEARQDPVELEGHRAKFQAKERERREDALVDSIQKILLQIHEDPVHASAARTVFSLVRKWLTYYRTLHSSRPLKPGERLNTPDTPQWRHLKAIFKNIKELTERLAGGKSLDPLLLASEKVITLPLQDRNEQQQRDSELEPIMELVTLFNQIASNSLGVDQIKANSDSKQREYISSDFFRRDVSTLIEKVQKVEEAKGSPISLGAHSSSSNESADDVSLSISKLRLFAFRNEFGSLLSSLYTDRTFRLLRHALHTLVQDVEDYLWASPDNSPKYHEPGLKGGFSSVITAALNDVFGFIVPNVVSGILDSFLGEKAATHATMDHGSNPQVAYAEQITREWSFPLPLPRLELVSDVNTLSKSESRWLEGVLDPRLMTVRIQDDELEEVQLEREEGAPFQSVLTSCFRWCCCSYADRDLYADAEAGYVIVPMQPAQLDLVNLLIPSSIAVTQWSQTTVDFYSSAPPPVAPSAAFDSEPLLVDVSVPGEEPLPDSHAGKSVDNLPVLVDFDVSTSASMPTNQNQRGPDADEVEVEHLYAIVNNGASNGGGKSTKTAVQTTNRIHLHLEGILTSLPHLPVRLPISSPSTSIKSKITRRLTLENIGYYARYNLLSSTFGSWLGIGDEGLLDLEFEFQDSNALSTTTSAEAREAASDVGDGASLDTDLGLEASVAAFDPFFTDQDDFSDEDLPFRVSNTVFHLPHTLDITPYLRTLPHSSLLNKLTSVPRKLLLALLLRPVVLPLAKVLVRRELESTLAQGFEHASEAVGKVGVKIVNGARRRARERALKIKAEEDMLGDKAAKVTAQISFGDVWGALVEALEGITASQEEPEVEVSTKVKEVGWKGVQVERTVVQDDSSIRQEARSEDATHNARENPAPATTTTVAVGAAPQLLPDRADPVSSHLSVTNPTKVADEMINEMQTAAQTAADGALEGIRDGLDHSIENMVRTVRDAAEVVGGLREGLEETGQESEEGRSDSKKERGEVSQGWRSTVFNL
ncbi:hypothetical protein GYMLUDRAFT_70772 [Collybiopsis luxurians FD-317 M1]|nr:hypothetical protein GYMLUDRAFT_70772 [Collybiopsis luxurians FD-317 M1]